MKVGPEYIILLLLLLWPQYFYILTVLYIFFKIFFFCFFFWRFNQSQRIPKSSISRQNGCAHRLMLKPFKWNVFWVQMIEQFVRGGDAASRQITLTTCYHYYRLYFILTFHGILTYFCSGVLAVSGLLSWAALQGGQGGNCPLCPCLCPLVAPRRNVGFGKVPSGRHFIHSQRFPLPLLPWPGLAPRCLPQIQIPGAAHSFCSGSF